MRQTTVDVGERHHRAHGSGAGDDDVGIGDRGRQVVERERVGDDAELANLVGQPLRAGQCPVHDVDAFDARAGQLLGSQCSHRTGADHDRCAAGQAQPRCRRPGEHLMLRPCAKSMRR